MGAWGLGPFENDDALDWAAELEQAEDASLIVETLQAVTGAAGQYLEAPESCRAIAAAETVAALKNTGPHELPERVSKWGSAHSRTDLHHLVQLAVRAIQLISAGSELKDLWEEAEYQAEWVAMMGSLKQRLQ